LNHNIFVGKFDNIMILWGIVLFIVLTLQGICKYTIGYTIHF